MCSGANAYGNFKFGNLSAKYGRAILRFDLSAAQAKLLQGGNVQSLRLTLQRSPDCDGDPACASIDPVTGTFSAYPLTNNWVEGDGSTYNGADWCRSGSGNPGPTWQGKGAEGADDRGGLAGTLPVQASSNTAEFTLDPLMWKDPKWTSGNQLSVIIQTDDGGFLFVTQESTAHPTSGPKLAIGVCQ